MRLTAPEAVGRERHEVRVAQLRGREPGAHHIDDMVARHTCEVENLRPTIASRPRSQEALAIRLGEERCNDITSGIEIGRHDDELAEAGLTEVLAQHLRIAPAQCGHRRSCDRSGSTNQLPDGFGESIARHVRIERRGYDSPPPATLGASRPDRPASQHTADCEDQQDHCERNHGETRNRGGKVLARKRRLQPRGVARHQRAAGLELQHLEEEPDEIDEQAGEQDDQRCEKDGRENETEPGGHSQRQPPRVQLPRARATPDSLRIPEARRAIDRCQSRTAGSNTVPRGHVDLDAGFLQRPQHAGVIGAVRTRACQNKRGAT